MDRRVKERLVGATILVVLVVLIVPELLSGPKRAVMVPQSAAPATAEPMRRVSVDLTTSKATATEEAAASSTSPAAEIPATGSGDVSSASPVPPESTTSPATPEASGLMGSASPQPAAVPPVTALGDSGVPVPKPGQPVVKAEAVRHGWAAQLGSFATQANAEKLERQLRGQGFSPFLSSAGSGKALRYRVRVGPVVDRAAAEKLIGRLHKVGHPASVVAP